MLCLAGKYISILGASTSTFDGFSNCTQYNTTLSNNVTYFPKEFLDDVHDTWWMRVIDTLNLKLCVNNSWSGSCITTMVDDINKAGCMKRATELHNDVLGIEPDIIVLIIGGNDALRGYDVGPCGDTYDQPGDLTLFAPAYASMVHKVKNRYPNADIYLCSMLHWLPRKHDKGLTPYNDAIKKIARDFRVSYVDFYNGTDIRPETESLYFHTDGVHPNKHGFEQMASCFINCLKARYAE